MDLDWFVELGKDALNYIEKNPGLWVWVILVGVVIFAIGFIFRPRGWSDDVRKGGSGVAIVGVLLLLTALALRTDYKFDNDDEDDTDDCEVAEDADLSGITGFRVKNDGIALVQFRIDGGDTVYYRVFGEGTYPINVPLEGHIWAFSDECSEDELRRRANNPRWASDEVIDLLFRDP